ncbi:PAS domain S-box protein [Pontibacter sp. 13R65]|uniref:PAS domain S-box protein n=1 Tax=Pontibacter sp. 13R65 TaxID=3127458 RepID=UPI00301BF78E
MIKIDKIQHTILWVFLIAFLGSTFFAFKAFVDLKNAYLRTDSEIVTLRMLQAVDNMSNNLFEINETQNNFLLTKDPSYLLAYKQAMSKFPQIREQIQQAGVKDSLEQIHIQKALFYAQQFVDLAHNGIPNTTQTILATTGSGWLEQKANLLEQVRHYISLIEKQERKNFASTDLARVSKTNQALLVFILFSVGMFLFFVINFMLIRRTLYARRKTEEAIDENQKLFSTLFYKSPVMLTLMDATTYKIVDVNESALKFFNNSKAEVIGKDPKEINVMLDPVAERKINKLLDKNEKVKDFEAKIVMSNGEDKYMSYSIDKINLGGKEYLLLAYLDVTSKKLSEMKLKESEILFSTLFYKSPVNFFIIELSTGELLNVNDNFLSFFGFKRKEVVGKSTNDLNIWVDNNNHQSLAANLQHIGEDNQELLVRKRNGELCYILIHGEQLQLYGKECMVGAFVDINASKLAETTIKRLNATLEQKVQERTKEISDYKYALDQSSIVAITDQSRVIRYVNNNFCRISGYSRLELIGTKRPIVDPWLHSKEHVEELEQAMQEGRIWKGETRNYAKDGSPYWTDTTIVPFLDEEQRPYQFLSIRWDITDKKKGDSALLQAMHDLELSANRLKEAQALSHLGSWEHNFHTGESVWSDETFRILGISSDQTSPSLDAFYALVHPEDLAGVYKVSKNLSAHHANSSYVCRIIRKDGVERHLYIEFDVVLDEDQQLVRWNGILHDITERVLAQQEKDKVTADLIQRNKDLQQFNYIISHNLRAPVVNIMGLTHLMDKLQPDSAKFEECLKGVRLSVLKLDEVIIDLNNILQIRQEINEAREYVRLTELVNDVEAVLSNRILFEKAEIRTQFNGLDQIYTLKSYLYSIIYNLVSNSIKYRQPDQHPVIEITGEHHDGKVRLMFRDNGLGINLEKYGDKVFGLYKRFHFHTEGKGMGLFMVKTQVEILGGKISVESEEKKGTVFTLEFEAQEVLQAAEISHSALF